MAGVGFGSRRGRRIWLIAGVVVVAVAAIAFAVQRRTPAPPSGWVDLPDDQPVEVVLGLTRDQAGLQRYAADRGDRCCRSRTSHPGSVRQPMFVSDSRTGSGRTR